MKQFIISLNPYDPTIDLYGYDENFKNAISEIVINSLNVMSNSNSSNIDLKKIEMRDVSNLLFDYLSSSSSGSIQRASITNIPVSIRNNVVQLDIDGNIVLSDNNAFFAESKEKIKETLGGVQRINSKEILIADSKNKRAIVVDNITKKTKWEYSSDRYILDARIIQPESVNIVIGDSLVTNTDIKINYDQNVIWENNSSAPIFIYSGEINKDEFLLDPDLTLYGDYFGKELEIGDRFSFTFSDIGEFKWFSYPNITTGSINVYDEGVSPSYQFAILESESLSSAFNSRVIKVDFYGNILWSFGDKSITAPKDIRVLSNGNILVSC